MYNKLLRANFVLTEFHVKLQQWQTQISVETPKLFPTKRMITQLDKNLQNGSHQSALTANRICFMFFLVLCLPRTHYTVCIVFTFKAFVSHLKSLGLFQSKQICLARTFSRRALVLPPSCYKVHSFENHPVPVLIS